ncbi:MAG TPA: adenylate/guanylate cyclase domain-containing protein [Acidimicrobiales bacterium]|nr:adenylate/guanylate cyclase domain-containing protein [Acidimicrobiales bacterium]
MLEKSAVPPSDAERDHAVATLRTHCADGRLTLDEFADRVSAAIQARTSAELATVTADLPPAQLDQERPPATAWVVAVMCGAKRRGRWRMGEQVNAFAFWGGCHLDLRAAEMTTPVVHVSAVAIMGGIEIVVPEGVQVEVDGIPLMGGIERRIRDVPTLPGTPVIKVKAFAFWGGVTVRSKPSRTNEQRAIGEEDRRSRSLERVAAAVQEERPDLSRDAMPDGTVTILFSDIEDFTGLTERLGDLRAQDIVRAHNEIVRAQVATCGGREVKSQGDSFMVSFAGAWRGVRCAIGIQRAFSEWSEKHPETPLRVRIGLHTGEAIREEDDLFGRSVILAARIAASAEGGTILVSSLLKELADSSGEFRFGEPRRTALKGLSGEHVVYPVEWEADE